MEKSTQIPPVDQTARIYELKNNLKGKQEFKKQELTKPEIDPFGPEVIVDIKFKTFGCGAAVATSSMVTEMVKGKTITQALEITNQAVAEALGGLPPKKMHCSVLAEEALRSALKDYYQKQGRPIPFSDKAHHHDGETCL